MEWNGPIFKKLAASELGIASHTAGIVPTTNTRDFFISSNERVDGIKKKIIVEFVFEETKIIIQSTINYYRKQTHDHPHITGKIMPTYQRFGAQVGDVLLFWKAKSDPSYFKVELIKQNGAKWNSIADKLYGAGGPILGYVQEEEKEENYQEEALVDSEVTVANFPPKAALPIQIVQQNRKNISRNKALGDFVMKQRNYQCELNAQHTTFLSRQDNQFMEKHHLIPMEYCENFTISIDDISNIVCVCPNCHRLLHLGKDEEIARSLRVLFDKHSSELEERGIHITFDELVNMYLQF